jgi:hypothetical protein
MSAVLKGTKKPHSSGQIVMHRRFFYHISTTIATTISNSQSQAMEDVRPGAGSGRRAGGSLAASILSAVRQRNRAHKGRGQQEAERGDKGAASGE